MYEVKYMLAKMVSVVDKANDGDILTKRATGEHVASQHLEDRLKVETKSGDGILSAEENQEDYEEDDGQDEAPPRESRLHSIQTSQSDDDAGEKDDEVPTVRNLVVVEHELVMRVDGGVVAELLLLFLGAGTDMLPELVCLRAKKLLHVGDRDPGPSQADFGIVPEKHVHDCGSETGVRSDEIVDVGSGQVRKTLLVDEIIIDGEVGVHDGSLVVRNMAGSVGTSIVEELGHEGEVLCAPVVSIVETHRQSDTTDVTKITVEECLKGHPER